MKKNKYQPDKLAEVLTPLLSEPFEKAKENKAESEKTASALRKDFSCPPETAAIAGEVADLFKLLGLLKKPEPRIREIFHAVSLAAYSFTIKDYPKASGLAGEALRQIAAARRENLQYGDFIKKTKFDTIYLRLSSIADALKMVCDAVSKEK